MSSLKKYITIVVLLLVTEIYTQEYNFYNLTIKDGLPSNIIYDIKQDEIGYLWIATEKGLVKFDGDDFFTINQQKTTTIFIDGQIVFAGTENGLFIKNKTKETFLKSKKIFTITKFKNEILVGTIEGIYTVENKKTQALKLNSTIDSSVINSISQTKKSILIASSKGLYEIHKNLKNIILHKFISGSFSSIEKFYNAYLATESNKDIFKIKNDSVIKISESLNNITSIKKIKNEVWITSKTNGIEIFTLPSFSFKQKINKYNSIQTNCIYTTFSSKNNTIWIASDKGIYILKKNNFKNTTPSIHFENLQINHQNADSLLIDKNLKLPHSKNNIAISFKTVDLSNSKKILYRYQLNGEFSPWSFNNTVQFANLKSGKYRFNIQSKINNVKSEIKTFYFHINPPFYYETWFIPLIVILFLLTSYISLDQYIKRIHKINTEKINQLKTKNNLLSLEQKALQLQMNPHFIFNVLNGIKALGNKGKTNELNTIISKFSILLRGILNNSRKEEIALSEEVALLKNYIELEQRMSSKCFTYTITTNLNNIDPEEILLPTMLIQPFVENCIQHAFEKNTEGKISIHFSVKHRFLHCNITDNGIGINESMKRKGNTTHKSLALKVSKERLISIHIYSNLHVEQITESNRIKGTKVSFKIPLKTDY